MNKIINNHKDEKWIYEFAVAIRNADGDFEVLSEYEDAMPAYDEAKRLEKDGAVVVHNVRVSHKKAR